MKGKVNIANKIFFKQQRAYYPNMMRPMLSTIQESEMIGCCSNFTTPKEYEV
jgi:hypothetical protein